MQIHITHRWSSQITHNVTIVACTMFPVNGKYIHDSQTLPYNEDKPSFVYNIFSVCNNDVPECESSLH